jgi:signal peptidase I
MIQRAIRLPSQKNHLHGVWSNFALEFVCLCALGFVLFIGYGILPNRWYHTLYVYSGSMSPVIKPGDVIFVSPAPKTLAPGMIITMFVDENIVTHRVIDLRADGDIITKGDANNVVDEWGKARVKVVGLYRGRIPYLGYLFASLKKVINVNTTGAWFIDREIIPLKVFIEAVIPETEKTLETPVVIENTLLTEVPSVTDTPSNEITATPPVYPTVTQTSEVPEPTLTPEPTAVPTSEPELIEPTLPPTEVPAATEPIPEQIDPTEEPTEKPAEEPVLEAPAAPPEA